MPATGDRITKRKDGLFQGMYTAQTPDGPKRKYIYGRRKKDVERKLAEAMGDAVRGVVVDDKNLTLGEYLARFLEDVQRGSVRESTYSRDKYLVTNHVRPAPGLVKLKNLNAMHLQRLYREKLDDDLPRHCPKDPPRPTQGAGAGYEVGSHSPQPRRFGQSSYARPEGDAPAVRLRSTQAP